MPEEDGLTVGIEQSETTTTIVLSGQLDLASVGALDETVGSLHPLTTPVVVDVAGVTFIDSSGLRALMALHEASLTATGVGIRLLSVGPAVRRVLELTGLVQIFEVVAVPNGPER